MTDEQESVHGHDGELDSALEAARSGRGTLLTVTGGAGAGKTSFLRAAVAEAERQGFLVLRARGSFAGHSHPFDLVSRLVGSTVTKTADPAHHGRQPADLWGTDAGPVPAGARLDRALESLLQRNSRLFLAIDDLHWADEESVRLLTALPERVDHLPVVMVATVCAGAVTYAEDLAELLFDSSANIRLRDLDEPSVASLLTRRLEHDPDPVFVGACTLATGGNPLLVTAVADHFAIGEAVPDAEAARALPDLVLDSLGVPARVRLNRVSPNALPVFLSLAVLEDHATPRRVSALTGMTQGHVGDLCRVMRRMGLLAGAAGTHERVQPLWANAVLHETSHAVLQRLHAHAAGLLTEDGLPPEAVARHLVRSGPAGWPWAAETLRSAARTALREGDPVTATRYLSHALDEPLSDTLRAQLHLDIAAAGSRVDVASAARHVARALDLAPSGLPESGMDLGIATLLAVSDHTGTSAIAGHDAASGSLAGHRLRTRIFGPGARSVTDLIALVRHLEAAEDASPLADGLRAAMEAFRTGSRAVAGELAARSTQTPARSVDDMAGHLIAARVLTFCDENPLARATYERAVDTATRWQDRPALALALTGLATVKSRTGAVTEAVRDARSAMSLFEQAGLDLSSRLAQISVLALLHLLPDIGELHEADALLARHGITHDAAEGLHSAQMLMARGRLRVALGQPRSGIRDLEAAGRRFIALEISNPSVSAWRTILAEAHLATGDEVSAVAHAREDVRLARRWGAASVLGSSLRVLARAAPRSERLPLLEEAVAQLRTGTNTVALARTLTDYGTLLTGMDGAEARARRALREAVELARAAGVAPLLREATAGLTAAGGRNRPPRAPGWSSLTPSERTVAELAVQRLTNREIARRIFVQPRTVEVHLTNVYRKLGIQGRGELPRTPPEVG
ncbi:LuxR family transcriptional regulator [Streptomyces sp. NPDC093970]|uniref:LuxR family transcriptional regulator n=1 Tax=Streptomyces sp. NPDC093970 TaxID=3155076 RepID=UPI0034407C13